MDSREGIPHSKEKNEEVYISNYNYEVIPIVYNGQEVLLDIRNSWFSWNGGEGNLDKFIKLFNHQKAIQVCLIISKFVDDKLKEKRNDSWRVRETIRNYKRK